MKKILLTGLFILLAGCQSNEYVVIKTDDPMIRENSDSLKIRVAWDDHEVIYELNDSLAAKGLYDALPITVMIEDYSDNEKIFYPENTLDTSDAPLASGGPGTLAYYAPWGDVVFFYGEYHENSALYALGEVINGEDLIGLMNGEVLIEAYN